MIFITGGVRSGKSAYAEQLVTKFASEKQVNKVYVATSVAFDTEMKRRIQQHQYDRQHANWETIEAPYTLSSLLDVKGIILFECVTTWLSNVLYEQEAQVDAYIAEFQRVVTALHGRIVIVSNEVLADGVSPYIETERYKRLLGMLHQWLVAQSEAAYECTFRHIIQWKGETECKGFC